MLLPPPTWRYSQHGADSETVTACIISIIYPFLSLLTLSFSAKSQVISKTYPVKTWYWKHSHTCFASFDIKYNLEFDNSWLIFYSTDQHCWKNWTIRDIPDVKLYKYISIFCHINWTLDSGQTAERWQTPPLNLTFSDLLDDSNLTLIITVTVTTHSHS